MFNMMLYDWKLCDGVGGRVFVGSVQALFVILFSELKYENCVLR